MKNLPLFFGSILLVIYIIFAFAGQYLPFIDETLEEELMRRDDSGLSIPPYPPSDKNWLGSDHKGRDLLSLLVIGTKETLLVIFLVAGLRYLLALPLGAAASNYKFFRWILDSWNYLLSFIPPIFLVALFIGIPFVFFSENIFAWYVFILAIVEVGRVAEMVRSQMVHMSKQEFIEAAATSGTSPFKMFVRHYLPHLRPQILTAFAADLGRVLFLIAQLAVIQIFVKRKFVTNLGGGYENYSESISYPVLLATIRSDIWTRTWIPYFTVLFITLLIMAFFLLSEGIKRYFQKKYRMGA